MIIRKLQMAGIFLMTGFLLCACGGKTESPNNTTAPVTETPKATVEVVELPESSYTTLKDGVYTSIDGVLQVTVPEHWSVSKEDAKVLLAGTEEDTKDCLTVLYSDKEEGFADYEVSDFEKHYSQSLDNYVATSYTRTTVAGQEAGCLEYTFSTETADVTGYEYFIDGNYTYILSFIDVTGELKDQIPDILESVKLCK